MLFPLNLDIIEGEVHGLRRRCLLQQLNLDVIYSKVDCAKVMGDPLELKVEIRKCIPI